MLKTLLNNFTHNEIHAEIEPISLQGKKLNLIFSPRDKKAFKFHDEDYSVSITKINAQPVSLFYKLRFSSYMAFMCDIDSDRIFLKNFIDRSITLNSDPLSAVRRTSATVSKESYNFTTTTNAVNNPSPVIFQTTTTTFNSNPEVRETQFFTTTSNSQTTTRTINSNPQVFTTTQTTTRTINSNPQVQTYNQVYSNPQVFSTQTTTKTNTIKSNPLVKKISANTFIKRESTNTHISVPKENFKVEINEENDIFAKKPQQRSIFSSVLGTNKDLLKNSNLNNFSENITFTERRPILPHEVMVHNSASFPIFIRLSGEKNSSKWVKLNPLHFKYFERKKNSIYKLNITHNKQQDGLRFNVFTNMEYNYLQDANLEYQEGQNMISITSDYFPDFERVDCFEILNNSSDNRGSIPQKNHIIVTNKSLGIIYASIKGGFLKEFEDSIAIFPFYSIKFPRRGDENTSFEISLHKANGKEIEHLVENGNCYDVRGDVENQHLYHIPSNEKIARRKPVEQNKFQFNKLGKNLLTNLTNKTVKTQDDFWTTRWLTVRDLILAHPNKKRLTDFNKILLGNIFIENVSNLTYYVRVEVKNIGAQDFIELNPDDGDVWLRGEGDFLAEFINSATRESKRYYLNSNSDYEINEDHRLINLEDDLEVKTVTDVFESWKHYKYFDKTKNQYVEELINHKDLNIKSVKIIKLEKGHQDEEEEELEYFQNIKPGYYVQGQLFTDREFPPDVTSFRATDASGKRRVPHFPHAKKALDDKKISNLTFKRPKDVFTGQYYLFKDDVTLDDVKQGSLGNCYLISVIASLALRPDLISNIFRKREINSDGFYELYYFEGSHKKVIFIDDNLVVFNSKYFTNFEFAKPNGEELWVMLIEKAYAKYEGGYSNIIGGAMYNELSWLTGAVTKKIMTKDVNAWSELKNATKQNYIITSSSNAGTGNHNNKTARGISNGHAYSIIAAKAYCDDNDEDKDIRLLRMRNPWGNTEWTGDYSDNCPKWTPELKEYFEYDKYITNSKNSNDGIFFIPFEEYIKEFASFVICMIDSGSS